MLPECAVEIALRICACALLLFIPPSWGTSASFKWRCGSFCSVAHASHTSPTCDRRARHANVHQSIEVEVVPCVV
jgi:hypothetical protein